MARKNKKQQGFRILPQRYETVAVDAIRPHPKNVNLGDKASIAESIQTNGFFGTILVQESSGFILAGKHRWEQAQAAGASEVPVVYVDVDDAAAKKIMLADNRTGRLGHDDPQKLAELLQDIIGESGDLLGTGFSQSDLDKIIGGIGDDLLRDAGVDEKTEEKPAEPEAERNVDQSRSDLTDSGAEELSDHQDGDIDASNVGLSIGEFRLIVARGEYEEWLERVRERVGFEKPAILAEIRRLLAI